MNENRILVLCNEASKAAFAGITAVVKRRWMTAQQATAPLVTGETINEEYEGKCYWRTFRVSETETATVGYDFKAKQVIPTAMWERK